MKKRKVVIWTQKKDNLLELFASDLSKSRLMLSRIIGCSEGAIRNRERVLSIEWMAQNRSGKNNPMFGKKRPDFKKNHWTKVGYRQDGKKNPSWKGGKYKSNGYMYVLLKDHPYSQKDGYILEHRIVMEKFIGRYLLPSEVVHHKNSVRDDNRIENLELKKNQSRHLYDHWRNGGLF